MNGEKKIPKSENSVTAEQEKQQHQQHQQNKISFFLLN